MLTMKLNMYLTTVVFSNQRFKTIYFSGSIGGKKFAWI